MENNDYKNATADDIFSQIVGAKGIKTEVVVKIAPSTIPLAILIIVGGVIIANVASSAIIKILNKGK